ncbi:MAG: hypothetical protein KF861_08190 [Planctomycetaceae bacterium]|nr:hypothetical protein [Planctomycetaceae bacterium]
MWLASRLCVKQVITTAQFAEAVELQLSRRPSLGTLAVQRGMMTVDQVTAVSAQQSDEPDRAFGELAVDLGFLAREQLARLMFEQSDQAPSLGDILVEIGALTAEELRRETQEARIIANLYEELSRDVCVHC